MKLSKAINECGDREIDPNEFFKLFIPPKKEPELKKIDMSRCIESGIDCEFSDDNENWMIGKLKEIMPDEAPYFKRGGGYLNHDYFNHCRPRMNHPHACPDGFDECPLPEGFVVKVYHRSRTNPEPDTSEATDYKWISRNHESDIIAFDVIGFVDGYRLP